MAFEQLVAEANAKKEKKKAAPKEKHTNPQDIPLENSGPRS